MPQSLARLIVHVVFSTKNRARFLTNEIRPHLFAYLATVGRDLNCEVFRIGGVEDHLHLAVGLSRTVSIAEFVKRIKQSSSVWMKDQSGVSPNFEWQAGYGAFSLGQSQLEGLVKYIESQQEHHRCAIFSGRIPRSTHQIRHQPG
ncbi:IS200/IS605 family transposase [Luteolibacter luteus]|uniref:IS200/IS605 family transposase n=1 Tax=Luteolibacter luteus TaxID=2728835 RepID=UPI001F105D1B|nr:IS200/IS605 family transposase [Luteolibacter luteus]